MSLKLKGTVLTAGLLFCLVFLPQIQGADENSEECKKLVKKYHDKDWAGSNPDYGLNLVKLGNDYLKAGVKEPSKIKKAFSSCLKENSDLFYKEGAVIDVSRPCKAFKNFKKCMKIYFPSETKAIQ